MIRKVSWSILVRTQRRDVKYKLNGNYIHAIRNKNRHSMDFRKHLNRTELICFGNQTSQPCVLFNRCYDKRQFKSAPNRLLFIQNLFNSLRIGMGFVIVVNRIKTSESEHHSNRTWTLFGLDGCGLSNPHNNWLHINMSLIHTHYQIFLYMCLSLSPKKLFSAQVRMC